MAWLKEILTIIKSLPAKMQFVLVLIIIVSLSGIYFYKEMHSYKLELARIERQDPKYSPQTKNQNRTKVNRIDQRDNKQTAQSGFTK